MPYRMWRAPALDFIVTAGVTYRASDGMRVDRQSSIICRGPDRASVLRCAAQPRMRPASRACCGFGGTGRTRTGLLGSAAGHLRFREFGDVSGFDSTLPGTAASGRGAILTNRPLAARAAFDRTRFEGDLPTGWEAEIYRNGELLGFAKPSGSQRYVFEDGVQLLYGENKVQIILYGPQGQTRTREEIINVGQDNVPLGKTWYWAGFSQPGRDVLQLDKPPDNGDLPKAQATVPWSTGSTSERLSALSRVRCLVGDEHLTFVEGNVRRAIGPRSSR